VIELIARGGNLYCEPLANGLGGIHKEDTILLCYNPTTYGYTSDGERYVDKAGGDVDTVQWPDPDKGQLRSALYDLREQGYIPARDEMVRLPDGTLQPF